MILTEYLDTVLVRKPLREQRRCNEKQFYSVGPDSMRGSNVLYGFAVTVFDGTSYSSRTNADYFVQLLLVVRMLRRRSP